MYKTWAFYQSHAASNKSLQSKHDATLTCQPLWAHLWRPGIPVKWYTKQCCGYDQKQLELSLLQYASKLQRLTYLASRMQRHRIRNGDSLLDAAGDGGFNGHPWSLYCGSLQARRRLLLNLETGPSERASASIVHWSNHRLHLDWSCVFEHSWRQ